MPLLEYKKTETQIRLTEKKKRKPEQREVTQQKKTTIIKLLSLKKILLPGNKSYEKKTVKTQNDIGN